jgi:uncharacterized membrane protein YgdD (TMEM256/DUF423 family)
MNYVSVAGWLGALGVAAGAFGAHGLKKVDGITDQRINMFSTGAHYQMIHAVSHL